MKGKIVASLLFFSCYLISCSKETVEPEPPATNTPVATTESIQVFDANQVWARDQLKTTGSKVIIASMRSFSTPLIQTGPLKKLNFKYGLRAYADNSVRLSEYFNPFGPGFEWIAYRNEDAFGNVSYSFKNVTYQKWLTRNGNGEPILVDGDGFGSRFDLADGVTYRRVDYVTFLFTLGLNGRRAFDAPFMDEGARVEGKVPDLSSQNQQWILWGDIRP